jgi:hypothetical protein
MKPSWNFEDANPIAQEYREAPMEGDIKRAKDSLHPRRRNGEFHPVGRLGSSLFFVRFTEQLPSIHTCNLPAKIGTGPVQ